MSGSPTKEYSLIPLQEAETAFINSLLANKRKEGRDFPIFAHVEKKGPSRALIP